MRVEFEKSDVVVTKSEDVEGSVVVDAAVVCVDVPVVVVVLVDAEEEVVDVVELGSVVVVVRLK